MDIQISSVKVEHYRNTTSYEGTFTEHITYVPNDVAIGIRKCLSWLTARLRSITGRGNILRKEEMQPNVDHSYVTLTLSIGKFLYEWSIGNPPYEKNLRNATECSDHILRLKDEGKMYRPIIAWYGEEDLKELTQWLREVNSEENETFVHSHENGEPFVPDYRLKLLNEMIQKWSNGFYKHVNYCFAEQRVVFHTPHGLDEFKDIPSSVRRPMFILMDMLRIASHVEHPDLLNTPGVVVIEKHLSPDEVEKMSSVFPNCQFIVSE